MADKSNRPSPSESATLFNLGTQKKGNDGNTWVVKQTPKGVKRWVRDTNAVPFSAPTTPTRQNYFLLKNGVQIIEEGKGVSRSLEFELDKTKIRQDEVANLVEDIKYTDGVNHASYIDNVNSNTNINTYTIIINPFTIISSIQEVALFDNIERILDGLGYGIGFNADILQEYDLLSRVGDNLLYYVEKINQSGTFIEDYDIIELVTSDPIRKGEKSDFELPFSSLKKLIDTNQFNYIGKLKVGDTFANADEFIEVTKIETKIYFDYTLLIDGSKGKDFFEVKNFFEYIVEQKLKKVLPNSNTAPTYKVPSKNIQDAVVIRLKEIFYYYNDINSPRFITDYDSLLSIFSYTRINNQGDPSYETIDRWKLREDIKEGKAFLLEVREGGNFYNEDNSIYIEVSKENSDGSYDLQITENGATRKGGFDSTEKLNMHLVMNKFRPVEDASQKSTATSNTTGTSTTAPTKKIELNIADIVAQTKFSQGLKDDLIKDFKSSGYEDVWLLIGNDIATTSQNIQKNIIGFPSGKNTYLQADRLAEIMIKENQKLRSANKPSALTNVEPIFGVLTNGRQYIYIYGVGNKDENEEYNSSYFYNYSKDKKVFDDPIDREAFFVKGDVISYEISGFNYESLVKNIYENSYGEVFVELENMYNQEIETYSVDGGFDDFEDIRITEYYKIWELFDNPVLVAKTEDVKQKSQVDKDLEDEIKSLNKQIADLVFLRSLLLPIDFEKKIDFGQRIAERQKKLNELNFKLVERRLGGKDIFDELFEQSFVEIKHTYNDTKGDADTDYFAPNGKKSELSDELNIMIRTPQFKEWFGDWEMAYLYKDTDVKIPCSKVVNANYEPMVVWHGTGAEFSYFRFDKFPATYFAKKKAYSDWFADMQGGGDGYTIPFFLDIKNPLDLRHFGTRQITPKEFFDFIFLKTGLDMDMLEVNPIFMSNSYPPSETWVYLRNNAKMLKKLSESKMNDGIMFFETNPSVPLGEEAHETEAYIIFNANQSKIASTDRGMLLLSSLKSFLLKRGGQI